MVKFQGSKETFDTIIGIAFIALLVVTAFLVVKSSYVIADPAGATISSNITDSAATYFPDNRTDPGGTINTLVLDVVQQNTRWKAYLGNISGLLTLDDSDGYTIFQWYMEAGDITGEVYASRNDTISWGDINCSNRTLVSAEDTALGFGATDVDTINNTYNETTHSAVTVAGRTVTANTCPSTAAFVSDTKQNQATADWQQILLASGSDVVYTSHLNQGALSYRGVINSTYNHTVDFQLLLADDITPASSTYYFFVEIGG